MKKWMSLMLAVLLVCLCLSGCSAKPKLEGKYYSPQTMAVYYEFTGGSSCLYVDEDQGIREKLTYKMVQVQQVEGEYHPDYLVFVTDASGKELIFSYPLDTEELYEISLGTFRKDYLLK